MAHDERLADRIRELLATEAMVTERKMFGGLAFSVAGHMAVAASSRGSLMVRVDPERSDALLASPHVERMVMSGRELSGWLLVDAAGLATRRQLAKWVTLGMTFARSLPPKTVARKRSPSRP